MLRFHVLDACTTFTMFLIFYVRTCFGCRKMQNDFVIGVIFSMVDSDRLSFLNFFFLAIFIFFPDILIDFYFV